MPTTLSACRTSTPKTWSTTPSPINLAHVPRRLSLSRKQNGQHLVHLRPPPRSSRRPCQPYSTQPHLLPLDQASVLRLWPSRGLSLGVWPARPERALFRSRAKRHDPLPIAKGLNAETPRRSRAGKPHGPSVFVEPPVCFARLRRCSRSTATPETSLTSRNPSLPLRDPSCVFFCLGRLVWY